MQCLNSLIDASCRSSQNHRTLSVYQGMVLWYNSYVHVFLVFSEELAGVQIYFLWPLDLGKVGIYNKQYVHCVVI